jgi:hypothetical protein
MSTRTGKFTNHIAADKVGEGVPRKALRRVFHHASHKERAYLYRNPGEVARRARAALPPPSPVARKPKPPRATTEREKLTARVRAMLGRPALPRSVRK